MSRNWLIGVGVMALVAVGLTAVRASAQDQANPPQRQRGQGFMRGGSGLMLLRSDVVAKDLDLSTEQKESLTKLGDEARKQRTELRDSLKDASQEERRAKMSAAEKEIDGKVDAVLNEKQRARLKEIKLQVRGASALTQPEIADALKLTDEQKTKLADLAKERRDASRAAFQDASGDRAAAREKLATLNKESNSKMQAVLTTEQAEQFEKMQGKKIDVEALRSSLRPPASTEPKPESK